MAGIKETIKKKKEIFVFILLVLISSLMTGISAKKISIAPKEIGFAFVSVFQNFFAGINRFYSNTLNSIIELKKLKQHYENIQKIQNEYKIIERDLLALKQENNELRNQLNYSKSATYYNIPCEIIAKDPGNIFNTIVLNKGSNAGVKIDMPVIAYQNGFQGLIGRIVQVGPFSSLMMPIFDRTSFVAARLLNSRYEGLVTGTGSTENVQMLFVKKYARYEIKYGDIVVTSGMSTLYPKNIYIGRVRSISAKDYETSIKLEIEPIIDFTKLEYAFILGIKAENNAE